MRLYVLFVTCLGLAAAGCHGAVDQPPAPAPVQKAVSASLQTTVDGSVRGPAAALIANNSAGLISDNGAGLIANNAGSLISLAKFHALATTTEAVAGAQVQVEDLHGHVLSSAVPTDQNGHYHLSGNFGSRAVLAVRARYQRQGVDVSLLSAFPAPKPGSTATAPVDPASTLVAKKVAAMVRFGAVEETALAPAALDKAAQEVGAVVTDVAAVAAAVLPDERTAHVFDAMVGQLGQQAASVKAVTAVGGTALLARTPEGDLPSPPPSTEPSPSPTPSATPSATPTISVTPPPPTPPPSSTPGPSPTPVPAPLQFGAYTGDADVNVFAAWLGKPVAFAEDHASTATWDEIEGTTAKLQPWGQWKAAGTGRRLIFQVPMLPGPGDGSGPTTGKNPGAVSLAQGASGAYDAHWTQLAQNLVANGLADTIVDPGYQCNLDYLSWNGRNNPTGYASYFQHIVSAMRAVPGANFKFAWGVTLGGGWDTETAYPGDGVVDYIAIDMGDEDGGKYPGSGTVTTAQQDAVWDGKLTGWKGLDFWGTFSRQHANKPIGFTAWDLDLVQFHAGGDNPAFIQRMHDWMADANNHVAFHIYWDERDGGHDHRISAADSPFPNSAAKFKELFGR